MRKLLLRIGIGLLVLMLAFRVADRAARRGDLLPVPPEPNGYDGLLSAARALKKPPADLVSLGPEQTKELATENRLAIEKARKAFQMPSAVPVKATKGWQQQHEDELKSLKHLAVAFGIEARSRILETHTNDAAQCHIDAIRLAQAMSRGGILIDGITGLTVETIGTALLESVLPQLDAPVCREAARPLAELDVRRDPPESIVQREKAWSVRRFGLIDRFGGLLARESIARRHVQFVTKSRATRTRTQRVMLRLAARAYEVESGRPPTRTSELVPAYLDRVPRDSETGLEIQELPAAAR
jgi:hypothetical protein